MLDFTSALYLGLWHPIDSLRPWARLTAGVPAALAEPAGSRALACELSALQGCQSGSLGTSTLHLFWDLMGLLANGRTAIFMDNGLYPVGRWGVERAVGRGTPVCIFPHHDPGALRRRLARAHNRRRPIVVADGFCPACGVPAPITDYLELTRSRNGLLILDDTQALGMLGQSPGRGDPYGRGGGGSLRYCGASGPDVILVSSLAKGFGVPAALISGAAAVIGDFEARSETRIHTSPPSAAVMEAARHALAVNRQRGDTIRRGLARLIIHFGRRLAAAGLHATGGLFPVQTLHIPPGCDVTGVYAKLLRLGVRTVLGRGQYSAGARIRFVINARHCAQDIDRAVDTLAMSVDPVATTVNPRERPMRPDLRAGAGAAGRAFSTLDAGGPSHL